MCYKLLYANFDFLKLVSPTHEKNSSMNKRIYNILEFY